MAVQANGITVDSWVAIDDDCAIDADISVGEIELRFGPADESGLVVHCTEPGLANLVATATAALREVRADRSGDDPDGPPPSIGSVG